MAYKFKSNITPDFDAEGGKKILVDSENVGYAQTTVKSVLDALGGGFTISIVDSLPSPGESQVMYLVKVAGTDHYARWIWITGSGYQSLGTTETAIQGALDQSMVGTGSDLKIEGGKLKLQEDMEPGQDGKNANVLLVRTYTKEGAETEIRNGVYNAAEEDAFIADGYKLDCRLRSWTGDVSYDDATDKQESLNLLADVQRVLDALDDIMNNTTSD